MENETQTKLAAYFKAVHDVVMDQPELDIDDEWNRLVLERFFDEVAEITNRYAAEAAFNL